MKKVIWGLCLAVAGAGLFGLGWISHGGGSKPSATGPSGSNAAVPTATTGNSTATTPAQAPPRPPDLVSRDEFERLRAARDAALQANPDLAAEYKAILADMQAQQAKFDAALIKADPKVAPVVAKLVALRQLNGAHPPSATSGQR